MKKEDLHTELLHVRRLFENNKADIVSKLDDIKRLNSELFYLIENNKEIESKYKELIEQYNDVSW